MQSAKQVLQQERGRQTKQTRKQQLSEMSGPNAMDPTIEAAHNELETAGVHHYMPEVRSMPVVKGYKEPPEEMAAVGHLQAAEFLTYEMLNLGQGRVQQATMTRAENMTYERVRAFVVGAADSSRE